jgi:hypothetical protein
VEGSIDLGKDEEQEESLVSKNNALEIDDEENQVEELKKDRPKKVESEALKEATKRKCTERIWSIRTS